MTPGQVAVVVLVLLFALPVGLLRYTRTARPATAPQLAPMPRPRVNPLTPDGFAVVPADVVYRVRDTRVCFTDSRGIAIVRIELDDRAPFLVAHDSACHGMQPPVCWHRSPDLPAWGGWSDWLIELDTIRTTGHALAELTLPDLRAIGAFIEYGQTQRAHQNGAHR